MTRPLLIATGNAGKLRELAAMLPGISLLSLHDLPPIVLDEPGEDYLTNAVAKAHVASRESGHITLADDSGLEVDALGGAPGWRSARYGGEHGNDAANRARLLAAMERVSHGARSARFRCVIAIADVRGPLGSRCMLGFGDCVGAIARAPRGESGFGYDPILEVRGHDKTMAEMEDAVKSRISHRARAMDAIRPALLAYLAARSG